MCLHVERDLDTTSTVGTARDVYGRPQNYLLRLYRIQVPSVVDPVMYRLAFDGAAVVKRAVRYPV